MRLDELMDMYRHRLEDARRIESRASVAALYEHVISELEQVETSSATGVVRPGRHEDLG